MAKGKTALNEANGYPYTDYSVREVVLVEFQQLPIWGGPLCPQVKFYKSPVGFSGYPRGASIQIIFFNPLFPNLHYDIVGDKIQQP